MGTIQSIVIRPEKKGPPQRVESAYIHAQGVEGDHFVRPETRRSVTIVSAEELAEAAASIGFGGDVHSACRRNICVDSFPEKNMKGKRIALGNDVILEITSYCAPCKRMDDNMGDGAIQALDEKAGWGAIVIHEGYVKVGDAFRVL